ncbi:MAG: pilus assembly PilX N-terminal domain-containing protein [Colwellia sp.]|nr:pilus assembly PilX N-terminal domain-containing protein [Colwellia sp.]
MFLNNSDKTIKWPYIMRLGQRTNRQSGSALVIAIFVIIVLSLLGAALVKTLDSSQESVAFEVFGTRAYNTAQTGIQWQLAQIFPLGGTIQTCASISNIPPDVSAISGFEGCEIILAVDACVDFLHDSSRYYTITSTGQCNVGAEITSRTIEVEARSL